MMGEYRIEFLLIRNCDNGKILVRTHIQKQLLCPLKTGEMGAEIKTQELHLLQECPLHPPAYLPANFEKTPSPYGCPFTGNSISVPFNSVTFLNQH